MAQIHVEIIASKNGIFQGGASGIGELIHEKVKASCEVMK